ncbi:sensor domain-containing diguanylate cyclase [Aliidiomarina iranensis]|uniref:Sensor domain-containing diguanylate cyclase n=1 Tax=Aliidiomarina iranensis TaxID=1434071 RepID=A0A432W2J1_9GAMM|nr:EAL domain-containing protein [Aliidiomarina iranensis]RUO23452.1 sensor domain-containing diguanylate cyclase [Aliidiomarina iranensis]
MRLYSIRTQLLIATGAVAVVFLIAAVIAVVNEQVRQSYEYAEREIITMANLAQGSLNRSLRYELDSATREILMELSTNRRVRNVAKVDPDGTIANLANPIQRSVIGNPVGILIPQINLEHLQQSITANSVSFHKQEKADAYIVFVPVISAGQEFGSPNRQIVVFEYEHQVHWLSALFERKAFIFGATLFLIILFSIFALFLHRKISRPVQTLTSIMQRLQKGEEITDVPIQGNDELAFLARSTERMLRDRFKNLRKINLLSNALEQSNEGVIITNLEPKIEYVNRALVESTGFTEDELIGQPPEILGSGKTSEETYKTMWARLHAGEAWAGEFRNRRKDGSEFSELQTISPIRNSKGEITHYLGIKQDITEHKKTQARLHHLAYDNPLSGLPNRLSLIEYISQTLKSSSGKQEYWLVLINIDRLKRINDARGYDYGNLVIASVAQRIENYISDNVYLAHTGADDFACLINFPFERQHAIEQANDFAWDIKAQLEMPYDIENEQVQLTMSIGVASLFAHQSAEEVFREAEMALHKAKENGGGSVSLYSDGDIEHAEELFGLERDLTAAVKNDEIEMYLQGQFNGRGDLIGAEALARWLHPSDGMIPPDKFVSIAERSDLIIQLDRKMLQHAASCLANWQAKDLNYTLSVNISPRYFRSKQLKAELEAMFAAANANLRGLVLEVTERLFIDDMHDVIKQMSTISKLGVQFALDDFGTGYSSLAYLQRLPIHELKIDKSFTQGLPKNQRAVSMVNMITAIARNLELRIVAEGIETSAQAEYCEDQHIIIQGYYFDRPQPQDKWNRKWLK